MIMETPKGKTAAGVELDTLNLRRLRKLSQPEFEKTPAPGKRRKP